ncbi:MAG TPA: sigma-70 family RNA polymerase sigma factor [Saprospiraceae bacterium]|nr:sigma-70 family RNA polymerase sigma factor [Saprospiraceae bacterium]HPN69662.1 sigma-70 family RNA polymerase sigma factor [Saprospiraceae bacterium]
MKNDEQINFDKQAVDFRKAYGNIFTTLYRHFGGDYVSEIEDAIQNAFFKALKTWQNGNVPVKWDNWLYVVARNDLINQLKVLQRKVKGASEIESDGQIFLEEKDDNRLSVLVLFVSIPDISQKAKVIFLLKVIFGLSIKEISECTLLSEAAISKMITRVKQGLKNNPLKSDGIETPSDSDMVIIEEVLYAIFNIGFDSFNEKHPNTFNEDLCLEAVALIKLIIKKYDRPSSKHLFALFCLHLSRISAKLAGDKLVPFFEQNSKDWQFSFLQLGLKYLIKPDVLNQYYVEALIVSKHMMSSNFDVAYWEEIISLYDILSKITNSPIVELNKCYCLHKAGRSVEALSALNELERNLPPNHFYFSLVKADVIKDQNASSDVLNLMEQAIIQVDQSIRKNLLKSLV